MGNLLQAIGVVLAGDHAWRAGDRRWVFGAGGGHLGVLAKVDGYQRYVGQVEYKQFASYVSQVAYPVQYY